MKTILLAPDSFKGSLSAVEFCHIAEQTLHNLDANIQVISRPMSDGGEGFVDAFIYAGMAERQTRIVQDPLARPVSADFAWQSTTKTAIVEMAQASGLPLLSIEERNPLKTTTYGTGQLLQAAVDMGAKKIILGLGGSATHDAGMGALQALKFKCLNASGDSIAQGSEALIDLNQIIDNQPGLAEIDWVMACDVNNPLLGEKGATAIFAPQKGASNEMLPTLEKHMTHLANQLDRYSDKEVRHIPGSGAAGGMAASFVAILNAKLVSGFELLSDYLCLPQLFESQAIDLVITGEGMIDQQSLFGKLPFRIAQLAQQHQTQTVALCGKLALDKKDFFPFKHCLSIHPQTKLSLADCYAQTPQNLAKTLQEGINQWLR
ncbi:MAG: glycerate kinase [Piscirickettsiaceae bacterium CG_4_9_14_3_um_filter_43_564]|nr:glycerate kinase [Thiomicrospira sp.]OIP95687.1 MAG: glycerate kinase [Thiomicrospira sp. CG2_30_44_34]PIQ05416.1 MAG: glycerate kinase [Piscirickettsiaceae bacterium CG18_big_fil_WC_8_21_14_2_50_44_103]PIU38264.1 MAG: glycerate kinase [Piscirickettsiaceae bacterium CG07_land_8_20_14_0_80_44_28]PIW57617.1 MAG: glycerate kinase [Piscirickettsiaceae bacterium CG12_big_fil_rev_8_21_14_0_65_44_934]PIW77371.1 MAG: glycerate kinase [Piscirickettsiaceae bacterium CG_4_8_14_3_um_filter_44_38]PIX80